MGAEPVNGSPRYILIEEGEMAELIARCPVEQWVPIMFRSGLLAIDRLEPGSGWALFELDNIRREARHGAY